MKIIAIGRNYAAHAHELGNTVPEEPIMFHKPQSAILKNKMPFVLPAFSKQIEYEVEIAIKIDRNGKHISLEDAKNYYKHIGIGIDFTARDLQNKCKENGWPWEIAKSFDGSAPVSQFYSLSEFDDIYNLPFSLKKNDEMVQQGNSNQMIFSFDQLIHHISKYFTLNIGDIIFTGTPAGVGPVKEGDFLEAFIANQSVLTCTVKAEKEPRDKSKYHNQENAN